MIDLGRVGLWSGRLASMAAAEARDAVAGIEQLGFKTLWIPESFGKEVFAHAATLLCAGSNLIVATGIANIWARDATATINGARTLEDAYPGRFVLGVGVSHAPSAARRGGDYRRPLALMEHYLDDIEGALYVGPDIEADPPLVLAALGPKMLQLAARRTAGAHPYFVPVAHTAFARDVMGPGPLLAPEQAVVLSRDPDEARAVARSHTERYLKLDNYRNNLLRLGWSEADTAGAGSDALVDAVVAWGGIDDIIGRVAAHLAAGADHVGVQVLDTRSARFPIESVRRLAPALLEL